LKFDDQRPQLEQEWPEQGQPPQKQREAPEELRNEAEKLADNDLCDKAASWQTLYQREKKIEISEGTDSCRGSNEGEPSGVATDTQEEPTLDEADAHGVPILGVATDTQEEPTLDEADAHGVPILDLTQSEENAVAADTHNVSSRRSTLPYGDSEEHETTEFSVKPSSGVGRHTSNGSVLCSTFVLSEPGDKNDVASSKLPSLADMFKPKAGEWDCQTCKWHAGDSCCKLFCCAYRRIGVVCVCRAAQDALPAESEEKLRSLK